ncbi:MAG: DUF2877 domain-containing protein [Ramlibacter sp.]|nr:DUF2877 domain-containing protein [Ramlibacter sp.]
MDVQPGNGPDRASTSIRPLAVSALALELLGDAVPVLRAIHQSGLSLGVAGRPGICYLDALGHGLLPLHVVLRRRDLERLFDRLDGADLAQPSIRLNLDGVRVFRLLLGASDLSAAPARAGIARVAAWLRMRSEPCGLGGTAVAALAPDGPIRRTLAAIDASAPGADSAVRALIGRGAGSTPAGDDVLVGALAYAFASGGPDGALARAMRALAPAFDELTTATGATYLRAALQGSFGGDLLAFVRALWRGPTDRALLRAMRVAGHGATSGIDSLMGFVAAYEAARGAEHATA